MRQKHSIFAVILMLVAAVIFTLTLLPSLLWYSGPRFRTYRRLYRAIDVGMTREEVHAAIDKCYPPDGRRSRPDVWEDTTNSLCMFMDPEQHTEPNCEGIFLKMASNRVIEKTYSMD
jgi:hypothetical protein